MRRWRPYAIAPLVAFAATTAREVAVSVPVGSSGNRIARTGRRMKPPPAPMSVPSVPMPNPSATKPAAASTLGPTAEQQLLQVRQRGAEPGDEEEPDDQAREACDSADDHVQGPQALRADESRRACHRDQRVRDEQPDDEGAEDDDA